MDLSFEVSNQSVKRVERRELANYSQEYLQLSFDFKTSDWSGLTKFALFKCKGKAYRVALTEDKVLVPNAVLRGDRFTFMVYGVNNDDVRVTTVSTLLYLEDSGFTENVEDDIPSDDPSIVEQIYIAIDKKADQSTTYTKSEVDAIIHGLNNKVNLTSDKNIMQTGDEATFTAYATMNGMPVSNKTIYFYAIEEDD